MSQELAGIQQNWTPQQQYDAVRYGREMHASQPQDRTHTFAGRSMRPSQSISSSLPSSSPTHPYTIFCLTHLSSGNTQPSPPPHACPECNMDLHIASAQLRHLPHSLSAVDDAARRRTPEDNEYMVTFDTGSFVSVTYGVPICDILAFRAKLRQPGARILPHDFGTGPITVALIKFKRRKRFEIDDILYANCVHRRITRYNLAYTLACSLAELAKNHELNPEAVSLRSIRRKNDDRWIVDALYDQYEY
ncbi:hypothetical protein R3P38DRAFT_2807244 [Favolaschia claudopus]|uniref:Uncharacterized protein n=1 Tax=Favolaschia claudopus TaxID=2862362 RepID=A0AAV9ZJ86_9AGAR